MSLALVIFRNVLRLLVPLAVGVMVYLYLYPVFQGCSFPQADDDSNSSKGKAPFRLLVLADPQIEGDTSIPNFYRSSSFPHLHSAIDHTFSEGKRSLSSRLRPALHDLVDFWFDDVPDTWESARKRVDLFGNDFYLAHIYRTLRWWTRPSHVTVLGDLLGSQHIGDDEFDRRASRFWHRAFRDGERVPDDEARHPTEDYHVTGVLSSSDKSDQGTRIWRQRIINVAGNHDIGYAGDLTDERLERFERAFGKAAYELRFELPLSDNNNNSSSSSKDIRNNSATTNSSASSSSSAPHDPAQITNRLSPELRIVVLNNMNLDTPAANSELQDKTYAFVNDVINTAASVDTRGHFTLVLTHIPLYKPAGLCVDGPFFDFFPSRQGGGLKAQNQLSADASKGFLEGIFGFHADPNAPGQGRGRRGLVLNGHDHEGCDTYHFINQTHGQSVEDRSWETVRWGHALEDRLLAREGHPGLREITVRSMMGEFGGNAGLLSAWFDEGAWEWRFAYQECPLGTQYVWWAVHVFDLLVLLGAMVYGVLNLVVLGEKKKGNSRRRTSEISRSSGLVTKDRKRLDGDMERRNMSERKTSRSEGVKVAGKGTPVYVTSNGEVTKR